MRMRALCLALTLVLGIGVLPSPSLHVAAAQPAAGTFAAAPDQQLTADGVTLRYRDVGTGTPVVLIHGYTASLESLTPLASALAATHRVIAFDVRGFGKSSKFADASKFGAAMVEDVPRLLDHLKITRVHLIGHSMGALIAANVVAKHSARVASASLVAAPFYPDRATFTKEVSPWIADLEGGKGLTGFLQWLLPAMDPKMTTMFSAQALKANDLPSLIAVLRSLPDIAISGLPASKVPVLLAVGTGDPLHPLSPAFAKGSTSARIIEVQGADHINVLSNADVIAGIRELLQTPVTVSQ